VTVVIFAVSRDTARRAGSPPTAELLVIFYCIESVHESRAQSNADAACYYRI